ncbi:uncharacterized protein AC631_00899 [Debaryomyces fabryi]|uniref:Major facilitator superfamily (MFS) profile domain-containing protein n=1 Tax=Debaryomyces fabryi TaxID=58627 RepID=A0A0V1Q4U4_9ASCO|nr:uncharacterized protein AC631_00899 [Debaryomyces fabryi]KSA03414.1 hypothetical protein AC631_00899 [Debaryomyces fabryi]CUM50053.1 unnamed protein product [Debaryomyces fabryi]
MKTEDKEFGVLKVETSKLSEKIEEQKQILPKEGSIDDYLYEERPWWKVNYLVQLNFCIFLITLTSTNNGYDGSMLNGLQSVLYWPDKMGNPQGSHLGALSNGNVFGIVLSFVCASWLADKFGRWRCIFFGQSITIIGSILQGISTNYGFFLGSRIILGFGVGVATVSSPSLISELAYPTHRATATTFYNVCWYLGSIIAAWVTYGTLNIENDYSWRIPSYLQAALPLLQLIFFWMVPESPRYLIDKDRVADAEKVLRKAHTGGESHERANMLISFEIQEIQATLELEKLSNNSKYSDFIIIPAFRKRLFLTVFVAVIMQLSGNGLVSYYLNKVLNSIGITDPHEQLEINGCLMIYNLVISSVVAAVAGKFKRRTMFMTCTLLMLVFYVIWTILSAVNQQRGFEQKSLGNGVIAMIFFYYLAYDIGANGLPFLYITEIMPYSHRAKGLNIFTVSQNIIIIFNGFVNPIAMDSIEWKYYIVYCCILAVEVITVFFTFVETSGYTLEEVAKVFGDDPGQILTHLSSAQPKPEVKYIENA